MLSFKIEPTHSLDQARSGHAVATSVKRQPMPSIIQRKPACPCGGDCPRCQNKLPIQMKLGVSQAGDACEQEADRIAEQVMRMPAPTLQRAVATCAASERICPTCEAEKEEPVQRKAEFSETGEALADNFLHDLGPGHPLDASTRAFFEPRFGQDFSQVRVHDNVRAAESARAVDALAYTFGRDVVFGARQYAPRTEAGNRLLAHELTHVVQQQRQTQALPAAREGMRQCTSTISTGAVEAVVSRAPVYPDTTCARAQADITRAWPTAKRWVQLARHRLNESTGVAGALRTHFKIDPNDSTHASDLNTVQSNFARMEELFDTDIDNRCTPANSGSECRLADGRKYAAFVHAGLPADGITHCIESADVGFLAQESLIETLVHEVAHLADAASTDYAYRSEDAITSYDAMTRTQAIHNGDSYSEFARDLFAGPSSTPAVVGLTTGALLSSGRPRWVIGATYDIRSRTGIEVFDLIGGVHGFIALDIGSAPGEPMLREFGAEMNVGAISRSADTRFFVDSRLGGFITADVAQREPVRAGLSSSTIIGWADSGFRAGINLRVLYDFLQGNHAVIIGGEFNWGP